MNELFAYVDGVGLRGPGLDGWDSSIDLLVGARPSVQVPTVLVAPSALPPAERRRVGKGVKIALDVGFAAVSAAGRDAASLASVFTSSSGDGDNCDAICRELAGDRMISPTRFHNSVHNAPSGYWGIASGSMEPSTSLCAFDDSFVAGLEDALTQLACGQLACGTNSILLVAYDAPYPEPLHAARPTPDCFGVGLVLSREASSASIARIGCASAGRGARATRCDAALEALRTQIPAARALPLLIALATAVRQPARALDDVVLEGQDGRHHVLTIVAAASDRASIRRSACG